MASTVDAAGGAGAAPGGVTLRSADDAAVVIDTPAGAGSAAPPPDAPELHWSSDYIKSVVFGGLDGIVTTFAIIASVVGADFPIQVVILTGFAKLLGDGLSMGLGDCISEQAEQNFILAERRREEWEYANFPDGERAEMVAIYEGKGLAKADAERLIAILTSKPEYKDFFIDHMMQQELGQAVPGEDENPLKDGAVTFFAFLFWGTIPLIPYLIFYGINYHNTGGQFGIVIGVTLLCLFGLGAMQASILRQSLWKQGIGMMVNGGLVSETRARARARSCAPGSGRVVGGGGWGTGARARRAPAASPSSPPPTCEPSHAPRAPAPRSRASLTACPRPSPTCLPPALSRPPPSPSSSPAQAASAAYLVGWGLEHAVNGGSSSEIC